MGLSWGEQMKRAKEAHRQIVAEHGGDEAAAEAALRDPTALDVTGTVAEATYRQAMVANSGERARISDLDLPERVLRPEERVYDVAVGSLNSDTFPLLLVTDQRIIVTKNQPWWPWRIVREVPAGDVVGADIQDTLIQRRVTIRLRQGRDIRFKVSSAGRAHEVVALLQHLLDGGAPPI